MDYSIEDEIMAGEKIGDFAIDAIEHKGHIGRLHMSPQLIGGFGCRVDPKPGLDAYRFDGYKSFAALKADFEAYVDAGCKQSYEDKITISRLEREQNSDAGLLEIIAIKLAFTDKYSTVDYVILDESKKDSVTNRG